jgi:hypothetical protein
VGAVFDGRYIYYSPWWRGGANPESGKVLRYDTHGDYLSPDNWMTYDATNTSGYNDIRGLEGAVFDGRYVYFVPLKYDQTYTSKVLRYDTQTAFSDPDSWKAYEMPFPEHPDAKGFTGAVFDGKYVYFVPNSFVPHLKAVRYNTQTDFTDSASWDLLTSVANWI